MGSSTSVLNFSHKKARQFFLKSESYCNLALPPYFDFGQYLNLIALNLKDSVLEDLLRYKRKNFPCDFEGVNHLLFNNKDGRYDWRPFQFINPLLYVAFVNEITESNNWAFLQKRFHQFSQNPKIQNIGIPVESNLTDKDQAQQVLEWWNKIEQQSIFLSLKYQYLLQTDITNCYPSIYTHAISSALHGKDRLKQDKSIRKDQALLGNRIDRYLQNMQYGQTNGIPQGSVLMDFIAEILLGYLDLLLLERIEEDGIKDYQILRYRDDYRIFVNSPNEGEYILRELNLLLAGFGMKLNSKKTIFSDNIVLNSIKKEKLVLLDIPSSFPSLQKQLLSIFKFSLQYPNSGQIKKPLTLFFKEVRDKKIGNENPEVLVAILTELVFRNPQVVSLVMAILSLLLDTLPVEQKVFLGKLIQKKFSRINHNSYVELWLQRVMLPISQDFQYKEKICQYIEGKEVLLWNCKWADPQWEELLKNYSFINQVKLTNLLPIIDFSEIALFYREHSL